MENGNIVERENGELGVAGTNVVDVKMKSGMIVGSKVSGPTLSISSVFLGMQKNLGGSDKGYIKKALVRQGLLLDNDSKAYIPSDELAPYCIGSAIDGMQYFEVLNHFRDGFLQSLQRVRLDDECATEQEIKNVMIDDFFTREGRVPDASDMKVIDEAAGKELRIVMNKKKALRYEERFHD